MQATVQYVWNLGRRDATQELSTNTTMEGGTSISVPTGFYITTDHHWDTGAPTEYAVMDAKGERARFSYVDDARHFAEAAHALETS